MNDLRLSAINVYPIKSLGGVSLSSAMLTEKGLQHDRRWMLVDAEGKFMTQRALPVLSGFKVAFRNSSVVVQFGKEEMTLPEANTGEKLSATIWDYVVEVQEVNKMVSSWFSDCLKMNCRLVFFPEQNARPVDARYSVNNENVSLADAYPFLIIGQASLDYLNSRLQHPVPMNRFRPNFVFTGGTPHEEDTWRNFSIGGSKFVGVKPCARCVLITIDQETGQKGEEPLRTLATYRKADHKILYGQNVVTLTPGTELKVGDTITIETRTKAIIEVK